MPKRRGALARLLDRRLTILLGGRVLAVTSFADASRKLREYARDFGASEMSPGDGTVRFGGEKIARVSYNGRIWCAGSAHQHREHPPRRQTGLLEPMTSTLPATAGEVEGVRVLPHGVRRPLAGRLPHVATEGDLLDGAVSGGYFSASAMVLLRTGVPSWAKWAGGATVVGLLGWGIFKILHAAAPGVSGAVARRYLP